MLSPPGRSPAGWKRGGTTQGRENCRHSVSFSALRHSQPAGREATTSIHVIEFRLHYRGWNLSGAKTWHFAICMDRECHWKRRFFRQNRQKLEGLSDKSPGVTANKNGDSKQRFRQYSAFRFRQDCQRLLWLFRRAQRTHRCRIGYVICRLPQAAMATDISTWLSRRQL